MRSPWLPCALLVGVVVLVHSGVYAIPFLYSEIPGIENNPVVSDLGAFRERMLTPRGLLERPLSVLSYALNHAVHGDDVFGFHLVNVAIHALNTLLVYALARRFFAAPLLAGLLFGLHPLATACASQIFGRNYSLASGTSFLGLFLYMTWRARGPLGAGRIAVLALLFLASVLTKQSVVVLPLLVIWYELGLGAAHGSPRAGGRWLVRGAVAAAALVSLGLAFGYAVPLSRTAPVSSWTYVLSQLGSLRELARLYLLPYQTALIHDLPFHARLLDAEVLIGAGIVATGAWFVWRRRTDPLAWLVGALAICLLPTNSVLPKNEVIREWRLYPSLFCFALAAALAVERLAARLRAADAKLALAALWAGVGVGLVSFAHADRLQNQAYQSSLSAWEQVLAQYPHSTDAMNNLGLLHHAHGDPESARHYLGAATRGAPHVSVYWQNRAFVEHTLGDPDQAWEYAMRARAAAHRHGRLGMAVHFAGEPPAFEAPELLRAPETWAVLAPWLPDPSAPRFTNLRCRASNRGLRESAGAPGQDPDLPEGEHVARAWRALAGDVRSVFAVRDSLYAQQDHPFLVAPYALVLPPDWIAAALAEAEADRAPRPPALPAGDADAEWNAADADALFGSFPRSPSLHGWATAPRAEVPVPLRPRIEHSRASLRQLGAYAQELAAAADAGPEALLERGAALVAESDRRYFDTRRSDVIPVLVAHTADSEPADPDAPARGARLLRVQAAILRARLADGDAAVERYDLSDPDARAQARALLARVLGGEPGPAAGRLWLGVSGPPRPGDDGETSWTSALPYLASFRAELAAAGLDLRRLAWLDRADFTMPGEAPRASLERALADHADADLGFSTDLDTRALHALLAEAAP